MKNTAPLFLFGILAYAGLVHAEEYPATCSTIASNAKMGARSTCTGITNANAFSASTRIEFSGRVYQIKESDAGVSLNGKPALKTTAWLSQDTSMPCVIYKEEKSGICFKMK